ncbi:MAG: LysR substrate-binding domain-containing protein [Gammaproteobacteria bacterium]|nr:LysR substrate-binding domain-containing protein [Gammaproteobacteria bacterium]
MKLQQLKYLLAIVDNGLNITLAAESLFTSQPGVSKQLKLLESELGVLLFRRKGKSLVSITPQGQQIVEHARAVASRVAAIKAIGSSQFEKTSGEFSIATTHTQARYVLPPIVRTFKVTFPNVNINIHQGTSEQIASLMRGNAVDIAIASDSQHLFDEMLFIPCYDWDRVVVVPKEHELAKSGRKLSLHDLAKHPLITYVFSLSGEFSLRRAFLDLGLEPRVAFTARDADVIKTYVRMGLGVGIIAGMAFEESDSRDLALVESLNLFPRSTTWVGYRKDTTFTRYLGEFIRLLAPALSSVSGRSLAAAETQAEIDLLMTGRQKAS